MITHEIQTAAEYCPPQRMERHNVPPRSILKPRRRLAVGTVVCHASIRAEEWAALVISIPVIRQRAFGLRSCVGFVSDFLPKPLRS
jgi:hypothetical protein